ncbi:hypothetical protein BDV23DRAFT_148788 [Aspergillus alliaceus]|uniref:Uncharacterized protein n=1 Tax=Petromyces alliaceus TaxID=209559 RepID=A0A5N7CI95_PETAA|nr:hypothetical protein BDV23DRAFT_148788 [Aspergillus alliaceus]
MTSLYYSATVLTASSLNRAVLEYFFHSHCPYCGQGCSFCPRCGVVGSVFPDLFGGCGVNQSCPVCMGYDFATRGCGEYSQTMP